LAAAVVADLLVAAPEPEAVMLATVVVMAGLGVQPLIPAAVMLGVPVAAVREAIPEAAVLGVLIAAAI
jgi:hypothetical protein